MTLNFPLDFPGSIKTRGSEVNQKNSPWKGFVYRPSPKCYLGAAQVPASSIHLASRPFSLLHRPELVEPGPEGSKVDRNPRAMQKLIQSSRLVLNDVMSLRNAHVHMVVYILICFRLELLYRQQPDDTTSKIVLPRMPPILPVTFEDLWLLLQGRYEFKFRFEKGVQVKSCFTT